MNSAQHVRSRVGAIAVFAALSFGCASGPPPIPLDPLRLDFAGSTRLTEDEETVELDAESKDVEAEEFEPGAGSHAIGGFLGGSRSEGDQNGLTIGLDYGYRITDSIGVGAFLEAVTNLNRSATMGAQAYWVSPVDFVFFAGAGVEKIEDDLDLILRFGVEYEIIQPSGWFISPSMFIDIGKEEDVYILGLTVGRFL